MRINIRQVAVCTIMAVVCGSRAPAQERFALPIFDAAAPEEMGVSRVTAGCSAAEDSFLIGVRGSLWVVDGLQVFGELDSMTWDRRGVGPTIQVGGAYTLPLDVPADLAVRGAVYKPFADGDRDMAGATICCVVGRDLEAFVPGVSVYGSAGFDWRWGTVDLPDGRSASEDDFSPTLGIGAQWRINDILSACFEAALDDRLFGGIGMGMNF
jgi:hypothetical protein